MAALNTLLTCTYTQRKRYDEMINGCYKKYSERECVATERARLAMSKDQPPTQHNYTEVGFKKRRLPENIWNLVSKFYEDNKDNARLEVWGRGNTYTNHWYAVFQRALCSALTGLTFNALYEGMLPIIWCLWRIHH